MCPPDDYPIPDCICLDNMCEEDFDYDGIADSVDNCLDIFNPEQEDTDSDGIGDLCDNCPNDINPDQADYDEDGIGDVCDKCYPSCMPDYDIWIEVGEPECWCCPRQCYGDVDCKAEGLAKRWYVGSLDVAVVVACWKIMEPPDGPGIGNECICADFDHKLEGLAKKWRVGSLDIGIMVANWKVPDPGVPADCLECP